MPEYKVHPDVEIFPMHTEDEFQRMVNSMKEIGQTQPIPLGKWIEDGEEVVGIIGGRNRLRACEVLGIEPKYEMYEGDIKAYINAGDLVRRDLTKGQKAMAYAMLYPNSQRGKRTDLLSGITSSASERVMVSKARKILRHSEAIAKEIMAGNLFLDKAADWVDTEIAKNKKIDETRKWLEDNAPELYGQFQDNRITLEEAKTKAEQEIKAAKEKKEREEALAEAHKQQLIDQYNQAFEGLKQSLEVAGKLSQGLYRSIPGWLDDKQTTHNPDEVYQVFVEHFPKGYPDFQSMVNTLEAATRGISEIHQALISYQRNLRAPPVLVSNNKPRPVPSDKE
jgi:ParB-like nuclease domain.